MTADPYASHSSSAQSDAAHRPFTALTPDYFGENCNATNHGLVHSGKLSSGRFGGGLFGGGLGCLVVAGWGYDGAYALAGGVSTVAAAIALLLRQPWRTAVPGPAH